MIKPFSVKDSINPGAAISVALEQMDGQYYMSVIPIRPSTVTIYNVSTAGAGWTAIATGLTGVLAWKLTEEGGNEFDYAFSAVPATYMTTYGDLQRDTALSDIYVRRRGGTDIDLQLEVWTA